MKLTPLDTHFEYLFRVIGDTTLTYKDQVYDAITANNLLFENKRISRKLWNSAHRKLHKTLTKL